MHLRPSAEAGACVRALAASGARLGVYTDAPEELARVALSHLGVDRRVEALESGRGSLDRLVERVRGLGRRRGEDARRAQAAHAMTTDSRSIPPGELGYDHGGD